MKNVLSRSTLIRSVVVAVTVLGTTGLAACGSDSGSSSSGGSDTLTVLAASSLTGTFDQLKKSFESEHKGVTVKLVYDSSATLAEQAEQGAPGDVLATADKMTMDDAKSKGGTGTDPEQFASNVVTLAVPSANPAKIAKFSDIEKSGVKYVTCVTTAPCGAAAEKLLKSNAVSAKPVSQEVDVKSVLAKITENEADAGFVYQTDVTAAGDAVEGFTVPGAAADPNTYWVAETSNVRAKGLAEDWITLMQSSAGQRVFKTAGFGAK